MSVIYWSFLVYQAWPPVCPLSLAADVLPPFLPGAVFEEVYPGNSGRRSLPVWQVCDGGLTAAVLLSLSLSVFLSPVSPSFQPAAAESSSVCSYVTVAACWFMEHKRLRFDPGNTHTCTNRHTHTHTHRHTHRSNCSISILPLHKPRSLYMCVNCGCLFSSWCLSLLCFVHSYKPDTELSLAAKIEKQTAD